MKEKIYSCWETSSTIINNEILDIILIAHVELPRGHINKDQLQCSSAERFSIEEFHQIYQGIVEAGYYIHAIYYNELDFISDFTKYPEKFKKCLIYNLARNGLGHNKKTIIPAFCELVGINYSTSSSLTCGLCRNKYHFTTLLNSHQIPVPDSWLLTEHGTWENNAPQGNIQVICKPCSESASQGVNNSSIFHATPSSFSKFIGERYIVQQYIDGIECEVPVFKMGNSIIVLEPVGIDLKGNQILDEQVSTNYTYGFYSLQNVQPETTIALIKEYAKRAFSLLQLEVYGRVDFRISKQGIPYIIDVSTTPYTTKHSSFAFAFEQLKLQYSDIYKTVISATICNYKDKN